MLFLYAPENDAVMKLGQTLESLRTRLPMSQIIELLNFLESKTNEFQDYSQLHQELVTLYDSNSIFMESSMLDPFENLKTKKFYSSNWNWTKLIRKASRGLEGESILLLNGRVNRLIRFSIFQLSIFLLVNQGRTFS